SLDRKKFLTVSEIALRHHRPGTGENYPDDEFIEHHLDQDPEVAALLQQNGTTKKIFNMAGMISVIDIYDSLRSVRPYKGTLAKPEVENILRNKFPIADYPNENKLIDYLIEQTD
ncbi:MAG: hypothetical protein WCW26_01380, partial [Candidatus Buchananbacteria bacterium]